MPLYEFRCDACESISEYQLKLADPYPQDCPKCGHKGLKKIMSLPAFQLKGSGWYKDSYDGASNRKTETKSEGTSATSAPSESPAASPTPAAPAAPATPAAPPKPSES